MPPEPNRVGLLADFPSMTRARSRRLLKQWRDPMPAISPVIERTVPGVFGPAGPRPDCAALANVIKRLAAEGEDDTEYPTTDGAPFLDPAFPYDEIAVFAVELLVAWLADVLLHAMPDARLTVAGPDSKVAPENAWIVRGAGQEWPLLDAVAVWHAQRRNPTGPAADLFAEEWGTRLRTATTGRRPLDTPPPAASEQAEDEADATEAELFTLGQVLGDAAAQADVRPVAGWQLPSDRLGGPVRRLAGVQVGIAGLDVQVLFDTEGVYLQHPTREEDELTRAFLAQPGVASAVQEDREVYTLMLDDTLPAQQIAQLVLDAMVAANRALSGGRTRWFRRAPRNG